MPPDECQIQLILEHTLTPAAEVAISELLETCFPGLFAGMTYFKQLPHFRLLYHSGKNIVGHLGIDSRVINVGGAILKIFGVIDLCVHPSQQSAGIASKLLSTVDELARKSGRDFIVLMADRHDLYLRHGFARVAPAHTQWLAIDERQSIGLFNEDLGACFLIKPLSTRPWPAGTIDMLGYLF